MRPIRFVAPLVLVLTVALGVTGTAASARTAKSTATRTTTAAVAPVSPLTTAALNRAAAADTHFGFGLQASTDSKGMGNWMPRSGAAWDYAYRYIGGGAGTAGNWTTWAPSGTYPITYSQTAASKGYTPVFSYYQMLYGAGACTAAACGEPKTDLTNLNTPAVMNGYLADWATLMQRLGTGTYGGVVGYGKDVIVHVEPDLNGFAQMSANGTQSCFGFCTGVGANPSLLKASVASSGFAAAAGLPNTYAGFNQALLKIRDLYAPNVRLATHVSNWATGFDLNSSTSTLDPVALGHQTAGFVGALGATTSAPGISTYDMLFNDVSNKDAGYYTYVLGKPRFWDQDNTVFPNFHRWEDYVRTVTTDTGKKAILWQTPIGNQIYTSMNNTPGHYQDNRVEYIFNHVSEVASAGITAVLFGNTLATATNYADWAADGVTNPTPICDSDGWSSGKTVCNATPSIVADDDGGYLRQRGQMYYGSAPLPLS